MVLQSMAKPCRHGTARHSTISTKRPSRNCCSLAVGIRSGGTGHSASISLKAGIHSFVTLFVRIRSNGPLDACKTGSWTSCRNLYGQTVCSKTMKPRACLSHAQLQQSAAMHPSGQLHNCFGLGFHMLTFQRPASNASNEDRDDRKKKNVIQ